MNNTMAIPIISQAVNIYKVDDVSPRPLIIDGSEKETTQLYSQEMTGYAQYADTTYTLASPLQILAGQNVLIPNNAGLVLNDQIPVDTDTLYMAAGNKFTPDKSGDTYLLRIGFQGYNSLNEGYGEVTLNIGQAIPILNFPINFPRGGGSSNKRHFVTTELVFSGEHIVNNGGQLFYESIRGNSYIYDIRYVISRIHKAR
jgi:hypothetical protein